MKSPDICILMATYNGAAYVECQLKSIQSQTFQNWKLLIRDDGSTDSTTDIIDRYCSLDNRINRIDDTDHQAHGPKENFSKLLTIALDSSANIFMFCDQDDYWHSTKIEMFLRQATENRGPCLFFCDLELVDSHLVPLNTTFSFEKAFSSPNATTIASMLSLNHIPGCCIAFNRELAEIADPIPVGAMMHDWWLALTAASCGRFLFINEKLVKYRQHEQNAVGITSLAQLLIKMKEWPGLWRSGADELCQTMRQAGKLAKRLKKREIRSVESFEMLSNYAGIPNTGFYKRLKTANQMGLRKGRGVLRFILYLRLLSLSCGRKNDR
ncbi:glycosyltransferase family 2 protein [Pseudomonadota bacterium]